MMAGIKAHTHALKPGSKAVRHITRQILTGEPAHQEAEQVFLPTEGRVHRLPHPGSRAIPVPEDNLLPPLQGRQQVQALQEGRKPQVRQGSQPALLLKDSLHQRELHGSRPEQLPKEGSHRQAPQGSLQELPHKGSLLQQVLQGSLRPHSRPARAEDPNRTSLRACNAPHRSHQLAVRAEARAVVANHPELQEVHQDLLDQVLPEALTEGNCRVKKTSERDANPHLFFLCMLVKLTFRESNFGVFL
jgi:hypothetical protein